MNISRYIYLTGITTGLISGIVASLLTYDITKYLKYGNSVTILVFSSAIICLFLGIIVAYIMIRKMPKE